MNILLSALLPLIVLVLLIIFSDSSFATKLNANANFFLAVLTGVYVLLTYLILRSTRQSLEEQTRPFVVVSLPLENIYLMLSIKNIGRRPAFNINVTFNPSLEKISSHPFFQKALPLLLTQSFLAPDHEIRNPVGVAPAIIQLPSDSKKFNVVIQYYDSTRNHFTESYEIDLNSYLFEEKMKEKNIEDHLTTISKTLGEIKERMAKTN